MSAFASFGHLGNLMNNCEHEKIQKKTVAEPSIPECPAQFIVKNKPPNLKLLYFTSCTESNALWLLDVAHHSSTV